MEETFLLRPGYCILLKHTQRCALMILRCLVLFVALAFLQTPVVLLAQSPSVVADSLNHYLEVINAADSNDERLEAHQSLENLLRRALLKEDVFLYPFNEVRAMAIHPAVGSGLRVFSWMVPLHDEPAQYGCVLVYRDRKKQMNQIWTLEQQQGDMTSGRSVSEKNWPGSLIYNVVHVSAKPRDYYLLFGFEEAGEITNRKVVDVLYFQGNRPRIGLPVFEQGKRADKRLAFEYSQDAVFSLNFYDDIGMIVFDHLAPTHPSLEGQFAHYVPQQTFHGYRLQKGKWLYEENVDFRRSKKEKDGPYNDPAKFKAPKPPRN